MEPLNLCKLSNTHHSLHLLAKFLSSVFFISVLILCSSLFPFLFNFIQFCSSNIGKNYVFLLCNGILVFIAKNSGQMGNSHQEINLINSGNPKKTEVKTGENVVIDVEEEQEMESESKCLINVPLITQDIEDETTATTDEHPEEEEEEEEEGEEIGSLSAEELNKKCEDFIRKMKEEIKFEAQKLIMVQY